MLKLVVFLIIVINIKDWTLWSVPSPRLQLLTPTFLRSINCSPSLWSVVVWLQRDSVLWKLFTSVENSSVCIRLSCLVCLISVVRGVCSHLYCGHKECSLQEVSVTSFLPLQFFIFVRLFRVQFSDTYKNVGTTSVLYIFKTVSVLTFSKIVLLIVPINCKNFANLNSISLENW